MPRDSSPHADYVSTTRVADALGVSVSTVKRWVEDGILPAQKTAGGHRKLLLADVLDLARRSNMPLRDPSLLTSGARKLRQLDPSELADATYGSLLEGDAQAVRRIVHDAYRGGMPVETLADGIIAPAMHRIGHDWETGRIDVMHEHRATQLCAGALHELKAILGSRAKRERPVALGGALEGDYSELPSLLAQMVLLDAGWTAVNLGANTPLESLRLAIRELRPRMAWLSICHMPEQGLLERDYLRFHREAERAGVAVVLGGRALGESQRARLPYTSYGDNLSHLAAFARALNPPPRRPRRGRPTRPAN